MYNRPVKRLGGLGGIPAGTRAIFAADYYETEAAALLNAPISEQGGKIQGALAGSNIDVEDIQYDAPKGGLGGKRTFTISVILAGDYGALADVQAQVAHAVYVSLGKMPAAMRLLSTDAPGTPYDPNHHDKEKPPAEIPWPWIIGGVGGLIGLGLVVKLVRG